MSERFEIVEKEIGPVIEIEEQAFMWKMPAVFAKDYRLISEYIAKQGSNISGMPYARYPGIDWERELGMSGIAQLVRMLTQRWHFHVGMPTEGELPGEGMLKSRHHQRQRYARTLHRGPYKEVGKSYTALVEWLAGQGERAADEAIECYLNSPQEVPEAALETEVLVRLE